MSKNSGFPFNSGTDNIVKKSKKKKVKQYTTQTLGKCRREFDVKHLLLIDTALVTCISALDKFGIS